MAIRKPDSTTVYPRSTPAAKSAAARDEGERHTAACLKPTRGLFGAHGCGDSFEAAGPPTPGSTVDSTAAASVFADPGANLADAAKASLASLKANPSLYASLSPQLKSDKAFAMAALRTNIDTFSYIDPTLRLVPASPRSRSR